MFMYYAARTGTRRTLADFRRLGFGLIISAYGVQRDEGFHRIALDNGAWSAYQQGTQWEAEKFLALVEKYGQKADFTIAPDVVGNATISLDLSYGWRRDLESSCKAIYCAVQDGTEYSEIHEIKRAGFAGVFVGGTTAWKLDTMEIWATVAREVGLACHIGRVNTARRLIRAMSSGADSADGSGPTLFDATRAIIARTMKQQTLILDVK